MPDPAVTHAEMIAAVRREISAMGNLYRADGYPPLSEDAQAEGERSVEVWHAVLAILERHERVTAVSQAARALSFGAYPAHGYGFVSIVTAGDTNALTDAIAALDAAEEQDGT